jgi:hypothetical protein
MIFDLLLAGDVHYPQDVTQAEKNISLFISCLPVYIIQLDSVVNQTLSIREY